MIIHIIKLFISFYFIFFFWLYLASIYSYYEIKFPNPIYMNKSYNILF